MRADMRIRPATFADLPDIAQVHVKSWQQAYVGQLPQDYLDRLDAGSRLKMWEAILQDPSGKGRHLHVALRDGKAVGFVSFGPARDRFRPGYSEIYAIYLLRDAWGLGIGYSLFQGAAQTLSAHGYAHLYAWVLATNKAAIDAYTRWGGMHDAAFVNDDNIGGMPVKELMMVFTLPAPAPQEQVPR